MSIVVELEPQTEAALKQRAARDGKAPGRWIQDLLEFTLDPEHPTQDAPVPVIDENGEFRPERWDRLMQSIAANSPQVSLPDSALTREAMYSDHD